MEKREIARDTAISIFIALLVIVCFYGIKALGARLGMSVYPVELIPSWLTVPSGELSSHLVESLLDTLKTYFLYLGLPMLLASIMGPAFGVNEKLSRVILGMFFLAFILYVSLAKYNPAMVPAIYMFGIAFFRLVLGMEYIFFWKAEGFLGLIQSTFYVGITNLFLYACGFVLKISGMA